MQTFFLLAFILIFGSLNTHSQWIKKSVNTTASLRGLSVVKDKVVWASGTGGTVIKTVDGGATWKVMTVPGAEKLDFRDIEAFDAETAYILSIGNGESSRIYKTTDGGETWKLQFKNTDEKAFFDAIACWNAVNCAALSDPVDGFFVLYETTDGEHWRLSPIFESQRAILGEAAFAASGTCLIFNRENVVVGIEKGIWIVTGGAAARVLRPSGAQFLAVRTTPLTSGTPGSGIFSIAMFNEMNGVIVGGNYEKPNETKDNLAFTTDGGITWKLGSGLSGYRSAVAYIDRKTIIAVGTNGSDITRDGGKTWRKIGSEDLNAVAAKGKKATWAVGAKGPIVKMK